MIGAWTTLRFREAYTPRGSGPAGHIEMTIRADIGGDHQRIHAVDTHYRGVTFKHLLLPVWISAYRYHERVFRFLVNARTGEVQGERPWSAFKIALLVTFLVAVALAVLWFSQQR